MDDDSSTMHLYGSTVECYEELLGLCQSDDPRNFMRIRLKMKECCRKMESVINAEDESSAHLESQRGHHGYYKKTIVEELERTIWNRFSRDGTRRRRRSISQNKLPFSQNKIDISYVSQFILKKQTSIPNMLQFLMDQMGNRRELIYTVHLIQLKEHMQTLIEFAKTNETKRFVPNKKSETSTSAKELDQLVEDALETPRVQGFQEVAGMRDIKGLLFSLIILPKTQPQLFQNQKLSNSFLLFGPPGTGKTQVVHALAYEANANLYCITAGNLMSSYLGQTEKNVKSLFDYLRKKDSLSLLFIDEIDGFCKKRSEFEMDHNRRIKTELLCQINQMGDQSNFFLICATNCPWDLDSAFLRRFHKRLYVPLPNSAERWELFKTFIRNVPSEVTFFDNRDFLISNTEGWSGSDISDLVQQTLNVRIVELQYTKLWKKCPDGFYEPLDENEQDCNENIIYADIKDLPSYSIRLRNVETKDIFYAFEHASPTVSNVEIRKFEDFCKV